MPEREQRPPRKVKFGFAESTAERPSTIDEKATVSVANYAGIGVHPSLSVPTR
jgi:hypothetical protein